MSISISFVQWAKQWSENLNWKETIIRKLPIQVIFIIVCVRLIDHINLQSRNFFLIFCTIVQPEISIKMST